MRVSSPYHAHGCVQVRRVRCEASGVLVPKDKAVRRFMVRNIVDASAVRDLQEASVYECELPIHHPNSCPPGHSELPARTNDLHDACTTLIVSIRN